MQVDLGNEIVESFFANADFIFPRLQIGCGEPPGIIRGKHQRLHQVPARDLDSRANDDSARRVFDHAGNRVCPQSRSERQAHQCQARRVEKFKTTHGPNRPTSAMSLQHFFSPIMGIL